MQSLNNFGQHKEKIKRLIDIHSRRLQSLEEQKAFEGLSADPKIVMEIEDIKRKIEELQTELETIERNTQLPEKQPQKFFKGKKIRVLVGDDDPVMVLGLEASVQQYPDFEYVGQITTPGKALSLIEEIEPDVVIMDLEWWGDSRAGIDQIEQIITKYSNIKIIAFTAYQELIGQARQAGADMAIKKGISPDKLIESIRYVVGIE